jgi:hypothetical protein
MTHDPSVADYRDTSPAKLGRRMRARAPSSLPLRYSLKGSGSPSGNGTWKVFSVIDTRP